MDKPTNRIKRPRGRPRKEIQRPQFVGPCLDEACRRAREAAEKCKECCGCKPCLTS